MAQGYIDAVVGAADDRAAGVARRPAGVKEPDAVRGDDHAPPVVDLERALWRRGADPDVAV